MIFKIIGCLFIIGASSGIGLRMSKELKYHLDALQTIRKIMGMLKGEVTFGNATLEEAFQAIGKRVGGVYEGLLTTVASRLCDRSGQRFFEIWREEIDQQLKNSFLSKQDIEELKSLGDNLGYLDRDMQERTIDLYMEQVEVQITNLRANIVQKSRLYTSLGIMGGIFITIVMM